MKKTTTYPSDGARVLAETGKTKSDLVFDEEFPDGLSGEDRAAVGLQCNFLMNSDSGWIPSMAMRRACQMFKHGHQHRVQVWNVDEV